MFSVLNSFGPAYNKCHFLFTFSVLKFWTSVQQHLYLFVLRIKESLINGFHVWKAPFANRLDFLSRPKNTKRQAAQNRMSNNFVLVS